MLDCHGSTMGDDDYDSDGLDSSESGFDDDETEIRAMEEESDEMKQEGPWFNEACYPERQFQLNSTWERVDASVPREPRPPVIGYEHVVTVKETWPAVMYGQSPRLTTETYDQYLRTADLDIAREVVKIVMSYIENDVLKLPLVINMASWIEPWDPCEDALPRRSKKEREQFGTRVKEQVEALATTGIDIGGVSVYVGIDKHSFQVAQDVNQDWNMTVRCGLR